MVLGVMLLSGVVLAETKTCSNNCKGTNGADHLTGDGGKNTIRGLRSTDYVGGKGAADTLFGNTGSDEVKGGGGKDYMSGGNGVDEMHGDPGYDTIVDESTNGGKSRRPDKLLGDEGNDTIRAQDGRRDIIRGGPGSDTAYVDRVDNVKGVEVVRGPPPAANIDNGPQTGVPDTDGYVEFTFSANETCTFECRLLKKSYPPDLPPTLLSSDTSCESPKKYEGDGGYGLADGSYTFELRATDTDGNTSEVVSRDFAVSD
jgi:hypothetical protein